MGKKGKQNKKSAGKKKPRITMQDLEEMSSGSEGALPPEEEWDDDAKALKEAIMGGKFDHLLEREDGGGAADDESIEEVELDARYDRSDDDEADEDDEEEAEDDSVEEDNEVADHQGEERSSEEVSGDEEEVEAGDDDDDDEKEQEEASSDDNDSEKDDEDEEETEQSIQQKNNVSSKALHVVTEEIMKEKSHLPWAETFQIVPSTPLPFGSSAEGSATLDVHDDLKREVAFYDIALEAAHQGRKLCEKADIPFSRPDDFFVEMVKSDGKLKFCTLPNYQPFDMDDLIIFFTFFNFSRSHGQSQGSSHL